MRTVALTSGFALLCVLTVMRANSREGRTPFQAPGDVCRIESRLVVLPHLPEASGVAVGRRVSGRLWMHNDSGEPILFGVGLDGTVRDRVRVAGADVEDWEDVGIGPCPGGTCLYIADIGDNDTTRSRITIYRVSEPASGQTQTAQADVFHATYPGRRHDAEALVVTREGGLLLITKGRPTTVYRFPATLQNGSTHALERVSELVEGDSRRKRGRRAEQITGGSASPDGEWVALRSNATLSLLRTRELTGGQTTDPVRIDLTELGEPQGEGVAFGESGVIYLVSEGGGKDRPGTLSRLTCRLPR